MCDYNSIGKIDIVFYDFEQKINHETLCIYFNVCIFGNISIKIDRLNLNLLMIIDDSIRLIISAIGLTSEVATSKPMDK